MARKVEFSPQAMKAYERLDGLMKQKAADRLVALEGQPCPEACVKVDGEANVFRLRAGDCRFLYEIASKVIRVMDIQIVGHKGRRS